VYEKKSVIRDIVIPFDSYPHLNENQTLKEAIEAFMSYRGGGQDRLLYAMLLVVNDESQLVGKLSLNDVIYGLAPRLMDATRVDKFEGKGGEYQDLALLYEESTFATCGENQSQKIKPLIRAINFSLPADTHILKALVMMSQRDDFSVPVTDNGIFIGVLRLEEIFTAMCNVYCVI